MGLNEDQRRKYEEYVKRNSLVFSDRVVQDFFQKEDHIHLLLRAIDGDGHGQRVLEEKFRKFFFRIRFIKFLVSTIRFCTIDQLRRYQKQESRYQLIFDHPVSGDGDGTTFGENLLSTQELTIDEPNTPDPVQFQSTFTNELLVHAFSRLSHKQKVITTLRYALCYQDNEIARIIGVSPQAVCKTRNLALQKLRILLTEGG
ncbi:RNA polymerase sigma factor [Paenibacillus oleatilyticus]|uniref:RNA polymerase sigma factor n=1 Tax=Paenibacillus oleatilyticus TaxID=2594886 RepID=A0ABV4UYH4_9BACL